MKVTAIAVTLALLAFVCGNVWVFVSAPLFVQYFYFPKMVALTHTFTLGWISLMIVGVLHQLAPVAFGLRLKSPALHGWAVAFMTSGTLTMIAGFATRAYVPAAIGTILVFAGVGCFVFPLMRALHDTAKEPPHQYLQASLLYFALAALAGLWLGLSKGFDVPLVSPFHRLLYAHIHLAGAGWAGMMIISVMSRLFPQPHFDHPAQARWRFRLFNTGLIGLTAGLLVGGDWYVYFGAAMALAFIWYSVAFVPVLWSFRKAGERSMLFIVTAWIFLAMVAAIGIWFSSGDRYSLAMLTQLQFVYGFLYVFGWITFMILGMLYRIIPTHISRLMTAKGLIAPPQLRAALEDTTLQTLVYGFLLCGTAVAAAGVGAESVRLFRFGWVLWLAGVTGFIAGLARLGLWIRTTADQTAHKAR